MDLNLKYGESAMEISVPDEVLVSTSQPAQTAIADVARAVEAALESPLDYPALRLGLTPGDHVAILIDERLPHLSKLLTPILHHIVSAQVEPDNITLLTPSPSSQEWLDDLPDLFQDVRMEVHDPADRKKLSYLAATKKGRRVYLNRTMVDADQLVVLTRRCYDVSLGYGGGEGAIYPTFSDEETRLQINKHFSMRAPESNGWPWREEAVEVSWLLGAPFYIQVIEGPNRTIADVLAGPLASGVESRRRLDAQRRVEVDRPAEVVIATITGDSTGDDFADVASAFAVASRVVRSNGYIVVLSQAVFDEGSRLQLLRQMEEASQGLHLVQKSTQWDLSPVFQWASAASQAHLLLLSDSPPLDADEMFTTLLDDASQVQRLVDTAESCLVLPDAHLSYATLQ